MVNLSQLKKELFPFTVGLSLSSKSQDSFSDLSYPQQVLENILELISVDNGLITGHSDFTKCSKSHSDTTSLSCIVWVETEGTVGNFTVEMSYNDQTGKLENVDASPDLDPLDVDTSEVNKHIGCYYAALLNQPPTYTEELIAVLNANEEIYFVESFTLVGKELLAVKSILSKFEGAELIATSEAEDLFEWNYDLNEPETDSDGRIAL